jgi:hypothetical protein
MVDEFASVKKQMLTKEKIALTICDIIIMGL